MKPIINHESKIVDPAAKSAFGAAGTRVGMAAVLAASTVMPVLPVAQAIADEPESGIDARVDAVQQGVSPDEQQRLDDKQASEVNLAAKTQARDDAFLAEQGAKADLATAQQEVDAIRADISAAQGEADAAKIAALEKTLADAQAALTAADQAKQAFDKAEQTKNAAADALDAAKAAAEAKQVASDQAQSELEKAQAAYATVGGSEELEAAQTAQRKPRSAKLPSAWWLPRNPSMRPSRRRRLLMPNVLPLRPRRMRMPLLTNPPRLPQLRLRML